MKLIVSIGATNPPDANTFAEYNRTEDRCDWVGYGATHELPADGKWAGGNGGDVDGDDDPAMHLYKNASSGKIVGPANCVPKGNTTSD